MLMLPLRPLWLEGIDGESLWVPERGHGWLWAVVVALLLPELGLEEDDDDGLDDDDAMVFVITKDGRL